jgi:hypothetical protein
LFITNTMDLRQRRSKLLEGLRQGVLEVQQPPPPRPSGASGTLAPRRPIRTRNPAGSDYKPEAQKHSLYDNTYLPDDAEKERVLTELADKKKEKLRMLAFPSAKEKNVDIHNDNTVEAPKTGPPHETIFARLTREISERAANAMSRAGIQGGDTRKFVPRVDEYEPDKMKELKKLEGQIRELETQRNQLRTDRKMHQQAEKATPRSESGVVGGDVEQSTSTWVASDSRPVPKDGGDVQQSTSTWVASDSRLKSKENGVIVPPSGSHDFKQNVAPVRRQSQKNQSFFNPGPGEHVTEMGKSSRHGSGSRLTHESPATLDNQPDQAEEEDEEDMLHESYENQPDISNTQFSNKERQDAAMSLVKSLGGYVDQLTDTDLIKCYWGGDGVVNLKHHGKPGYGHEMGLLEFIKEYEKVFAQEHSV